MSIRSLPLTIAIVTFVTLVLFASAPPKPINAQVPTVVLAPQEFGIVATKPNPKHKEKTYCSADNVYFTFEPASSYSPNEYIRFYYLDEHKAIAHDEASLANVTVIVDDTVSAPKARLIRTEGGENIWDIVVTAAMKEAYNGCLEKIKTR